MLDVDLIILQGVVYNAEGQQIGLISSARINKDTNGNNWCTVEFQFNEREAQSKISYQSMLDLVKRRVPSQPEPKTGSLKRVIELLKED
jgi:hypothetical protein